MIPRRVHGLSLVVLGVALVTVVAASAGSFVSYEQTEQQLLDQRTAEAGAVLSQAINGVQVPLASAAEVARTSGGEVGAFEAVMAPLVGPQRPFVSAVLFRVADATPVGVLGEPPLLLAGDAARAAATVRAGAGIEGLGVHDLLDLGRRIGYTTASQRGEVAYLVYAESPLPADATAAPRASGPFADLEYALYLGEDEIPSELLYASTAALPLEGRRATSVQPFGTTQLLLVMTPTEPLGGDLLRFLPALIAGLGAVLALTVTILTERVLRDRDRAAALAEDNARLLDEQRRSSLTLQQSLLPGRLGAPPGAQIATRYWPASTDDAIGGDLYDVFRVDDSTWGVLIGDVCGKGLDAAALTALVRHTARTAARHLDSPAEVLRWVHHALAEHGGDTFVTACFGIVQTDAVATGPRRAVLRLAVAGHELPLLARADGTVTSVGAHGSLLGLFPPVLHDTEHDLAAGDRLVLFTDGITDAPGGQGVQLEELCAVVAASRGTATQLADEIGRLVEHRRPRGSGDDIALLVLALAADEVPAAGMQAELSRRT